MVAKMRRTVWDYRIGGVPRLTFTEDAVTTMQIPQRIRQCVVFLGFEKADGPGVEQIVGGTAFVVGVPLASTSAAATFLVTARHNLEEIQAAKGSTGVIYIRANQREGGTSWLPTRLSDWVLPTAENIDLALYPISTGELDVLYYPVDSFATDEVIRRENIGIGDDLFIPGLFKPHGGTPRNIPVVRTGTIAAMPEEEVWVRWNNGQRIEVYLIDTRSLRGLSGSPVFVYVSKQRVLNGKIVADQSRQSFYLLGLVHGHWNEDNQNTGVAMVVPARKILQVLNEPTASRIAGDYASQLTSAKYSQCIDISPFST
jgi:hypothetical protein